MKCTGMPWGVWTLLALLCAAGGVVCYARRMPTAPMIAGLTVLAVVIYIKTLRISFWK